MSATAPMLRCNGIPSKSAARVGDLKLKRFLTLTPAAAAEISDDIIFLVIYENVTFFLALFRCAHHLFECAAQFTLQNFRRPYFLVVYPEFDFCPSSLGEYHPLWKCLLARVVPSAPPRYATAEVILCCQVFYSKVLSISLENQNYRLRSLWLIISAVEFEWCCAFAFVCFGDVWLSDLACH